MAARSTEKVFASLRRKGHVGEDGDANALGRSARKSSLMRGLRAPSAIQSRSSTTAPSKHRRKSFRKLSRARYGVAPTSLISNRRRFKQRWPRVARQRRSLHETIEARARRRREAGADASAGRNKKLRGPYHVRALRLRWRVAPANRARLRSAAKRSGAAAGNATAKRPELIDWTMRKVRQLKRECSGPVSPDGESKPPAVIETVVAIISSPSRPIRQGELPVIAQTHATPPLPRALRKGDRSLIASTDLEAAITEAVRKQVPGCEALVGVIVQQTTPKSRIDANWALRGVKFGRADREKANQAIAGIVERMQQEFKLSND